MKEEKEIRQQLLDSLPSQGEPNAASFIKAAYIEKEEAKKKKKKKIWGRLAWATPVAAAVLAVAIVVPTVLNNSNNGIIDNGSNSSASGSESGGGGSSGGGTIIDVDITGKYEVVANNLESGVSFIKSELSSSSTLNALMLNPLFSYSENASNPLSNDELIPHFYDVNPFLPTAEIMMSGEKQSGSTLTYEEGLDYPYTLTFDDGTVLSYKEYRIEGKESDEEQFRIEGLCTIDGTQYEVHGKRESQVTTQESEYETEFVISLDDSNYIRIESENESEASETEESYSYSYYQNGKEYLSVELSHEVEQGQEEMSIEVTTVGKEAEYLLGQITGGFSLYYEIEETRTTYSDTLTVTISEDGASYIYANSSGVAIAELARAK